ncbi:MAG: hypothetical protein ACYC05_14155 [Sulfuricella sp.]
MIHLDATGSNGRVSVAETLKLNGRFRQKTVVQQQNIIFSSMALPGTTEAPITGPKRNIRGAGYAMILSGEFQ